MEFKTWKDHISIGKTLSLHSLVYEVNIG